MYYPSWFEGEWSTVSAATDVLAPAGVPLFGGNASFARAKAEIAAPPLSYRSRWVRAPMQASMLPRADAVFSHEPPSDVLDRTLGGDRVGRWRDEGVDLVVGKVLAVGVRGRVADRLERLVQGVDSLLAGGAEFDESEFIDEGQ